jgi:serine phosphatase RsbU (regulator of sigma subunit)
MNDLLGRFALTLAPEEAEILTDVGDYVTWQASRGIDFTPSDSDDVDLRTYLLELRIDGMGTDQVALSSKIASLKRFYGWVQAEGLITTSPFAKFNFDRPVLSREQIRQRRDRIAGGEEEKHEVVRLRALNRLTADLNRSADVQTALNTALETLVELMDLQTAWVSLLASTGLVKRSAGESPSSDFVLAAACGLPPGLEQDDRYHLRRSPDCQCQSLLRAGRLAGAVNIVECTRLQSAAKAAGDIRGLLFHATAPIIGQGRLLGILNVATSEWQLLTASDLQLLSAVGLQIAATLERASLYELAEARRARLERELKMARAVQASLLPHKLPDIPGFSLACAWHSAREVAGDFYDIFPLADGRWGIVIADVSDKGAPAAMYMVLARSLIRASAGQTPSPAAMLMQVNRALIEQSSAEMFVTVFYGILDPATRTLVYAIAGHNPPIVRRAAAPARIEQLPASGPMLGLFDEVKLSDATLIFAPGDMLVMHTDGLTDTSNANAELFGDERLIQIVQAHPAASAQELLDAVMAQATAFAGGAPQSDDITLLVIGCHSN